MGGVLFDGTAAEAAGAVAPRSANGPSPLPGSRRGCSSECYAVVGDGAETAALILDQVPHAAGEELSLSRVARRARSCRCAGSIRRRSRRRRARGSASSIGCQRFILLKLLTGELRVGVSQTLVVRALAQAAALEPTVHRRAPDGRMEPDRRVVQRRCSRQSDRTTTCRGRTRSSWPRRSTDPIETLGGIERLADRVEMGRHPRAAHSPRAARCICGRAARSSSPTGFRRLLPQRRTCRTARSSTARSWPSATAVPCPSPRCSSASDARSRSRSWRARCPSCSWPTTCSKPMARTSGRWQWASGARASKHCSRRPARRTPDGCCVCRHRSSPPRPRRGRPWRDCARNRAHAASKA